jgi:cytochrome d ubiquinol oxidase subunit I
LGYGYLQSPESIIPNVCITFNSFHIMVILGFYFIFLFGIIIVLLLLKKLERFKLLLKIAVFTIPLGYFASELGWIVAEVGRQPWAIQNILPVSKATSHLNTSSVQVTFYFFAVLFTILLIAELRILFSQIKIGPKK